MASGSADGIIIRGMKVEDYGEVKILLGSSFYPEEPLSRCLGKSLEQMHTQKHDDTLISMIEEDNCLVAVDINKEDKIVGIVLAGAQVPSDVEEMRQRAKNSGHITKFLSKIETDANLFERYKASKALNLHIISVTASMRGKGLGRRLTSALMDVGRARGFPLLAACCSSFYASPRHSGISATNTTHPCQGYGLQIINLQIRIGATSVIVVIFWNILTSHCMVNS